MKLVIAEYLRTLKERNELDRLLPDLLVEMGYLPLAKPQTGNRQFGVDLAARGKNPITNIQELLLLVIKQGDIGRSEWSHGNQSVRQSIEEILDVYLKSHIDPQDKNRKIKIIVTTNGDLKQTVQANWFGFIADNQQKAEFEFWGLDQLAELIEIYLLDEHIFRDEERRLFRKALALSGDSDYDRHDLYLLFLRALGLTSTGELEPNPKDGKALIKAVRIISLSAQAFSSWALSDGDSKQGLLASERALLWAWHRIQFSDEATKTKVLEDSYGSVWSCYLNSTKHYFERMQNHCYVEDGLFRHCSSSAEFSIISFELIGILATAGIVNFLSITNDENQNKVKLENAHIFSNALQSLINNNGICSSPCLDRHSLEITLAIALFIFTDNIDAAKKWVVTLVQKIDFSLKSERYYPISSDSLDDIVESSGWGVGDIGNEHLIGESWTLATLAGWCAILGLDDSYEAISRGAKESYSEITLQLWHPDENFYKFLYFKQSQFDCGVTEAPIVLPEKASDWRKHIKVILDSNQKEIALSSPAMQAGIPAIDIISSRHFSTPIAPYFWYQLLEVLYPDELTHADKDS